MKKLVFVLMIALYACTPQSMITGSWHSPQAPAAPYSNIVVASLTNNAIAKATMENEVANALKRYDVNVTKGIDIVPPKLSNDSDHNAMMERLRSVNTGAILTVSILKQETESRYIYGPDPYDPFFRYSYYRNFWGYYSYYYPYMYDPDYYGQQVYYIESNLYDAATENLVWSAQSRTYDWNDLSTFSAEFAETIAAKMMQDGMIKGNGTMPQEQSIQ